MNELLFLHIIAVGIWLGVVLAEFVIEFDGMKDDASLIKASKLHFATDMWIEVPAFTTVLVTGLLMLDVNALEGSLFYKVVFGLLAIVFNTICVVAVVRRRRFALKGDIPGIRTTDRLMQIGGAGFIPTFLITIILAVCLVLK